MKLLKLLLLVGVMFVSVLVPSTSVYAQGGSGLQISPVRGDYAIEQGQSRQVIIRIKNTVPTPIETALVINDFEPQENGQVALLDETKSNSASLRDFVGSVSPKVLEPGEEYDAVVPVTVPASQAPGTYYSVLRFDALSVGAVGEARTAVTLGGSVGYVLIVEVPGSLTENLTITNVMPERKGSQSRLLAATPSAIYVTTNNTGQTLLKPFGTIQLFDFRNKEVATFGVNADDQKVNVLPGNKRVIKVDTTSKSLLPGRYKAVTTMVYGKVGGTIDYTMTFWVLPPLFLALIVIFLVLIFAGIGLALRRLKSNKVHHRR